MKISELPHRDPAWAYIELNDGSLVATPKNAIKELLAENERLKKKIAAYEDERKCLSETITCDADVIIIRECNEEREEQIKELEVVKEGHEEGITWLKERIKALESIPHTDNTAVIEALQKRIKRLEAAISKMETTTPPSPTTEDSSATEKEK